MSLGDARPRWMLRKQARISQRRLERFGVRPDKLDALTWWHQIGDAAVDLALDAGEPTDWSAWPGESPVDARESDTLL